MTSSETSTNARSGYPPMAVVTVPARQRTDALTERDDVVLLNHVLDDGHHGRICVVMNAVTKRGRSPSHRPNGPATRSDVRFARRPRRPARSPRRAPHSRPDRGPQGSQPPVFLAAASRPGVPGRAVLASIRAKPAAFAPSPRGQGWASSRIASPRPRRRRPNSAEAHQYRVADPYGDRANQSGCPTGAPGSIDGGGAEHGGELRDHPRSPHPPTTRVEELPQVDRE
jgi:hypothetical protein